MRRTATLCLAGVGAVATCTSPGLDDAAHSCDAAAPSSALLQSRTTWDNRSLLGPLYGFDQNLSATEVELLAEPNEATIRGPQELPSRRLSQPASEETRTTPIGPPRSSQRTSVFQTGDVSHDETPCPTPAPLEDQACGEANLLQLSSARLAHSNLCGLGPNRGATEEVLYGDVFPNSGRNVSLHITGFDCSKYTAGQQAAATDLAEIALATGIDSYQVVLHFAFTDAASGKEAFPPGPFWLGMYDLTYEVSGDGSALVDTITVLARVVFPHEVSIMSTVSVVSNSGMMTFSGTTSMMSTISPVTPSEGDQGTQAGLLLPSISYFNLQFATSARTSGSVARILLGGPPEFICKEEPAPTDSPTPLPTRIPGFSRSRA